MDKKFRYLAQTFIPFLIAGIGIVLAISLLIMFSYVLVWGLMLGGIMWGGMLIKNYLFPSQKIKDLDKKEPRIIEHDEQK